jgi:hypothetical protein
MLGQISFEMSLVWVRYTTPDNGPKSDPNCSVIHIFDVLTHPNPILFRPSKYYLVRPLEKIGLILFFSLEYIEELHIFIL